jgi:hypothetical protein
VNNIRRENDILFALMPLVENTNSTATPTASESGQDDPVRSNVSSQSVGTRAGVQRTNNQTNSFQGLFMDITNMLVNGSGSPEVNRGLTSEQISSTIQDTLYGNLPANVRESHTTCPITLDLFEDSMEVGVIRSCGHVFRRDAIKNWLSTRHTCPSCRRNLSETDNSENSNAANATNTINNLLGQQASVSSTHPTTGLHFINPTVRQTQEPNQQVNLVFDGIIGVPNSVGDETAQRQHITSVLEQMFNLPDITGNVLQRMSESNWNTDNTTFGALGEITRNYESESEHENENDASPE